MERLVILTGLFLFHKRSKLNYVFYILLKDCFEFTSCLKQKKCLTNKRQAFLNEVLLGVYFNFANASFKLEMITGTSAAAQVPTDILNQVDSSEVPNA